MVLNQGLRNNPSKPKHFFDIGGAEKRKFRAPRIPSIFQNFRIFESWSPAGELRASLRPAGRLPERISIDYSLKSIGFL